MPVQNPLFLTYSFEMNCYSLFSHTIKRPLNMEDIAYAVPANVQFSNDKKVLFKLLLSNIKWKPT